MSFFTIVAGKVNAVLRDSANNAITSVLDGAGARRLHVETTGTVTSIPVENATSDSQIGYVASSSTARKAVQATVYTEQTVNFQGSIVSSSASDTAAGTGARTVKITYFSSSLTSVLTETVTLNGTTPVNLVNTNHCYIERIEVVTAGATGSNVGIITLKAALAGGGTTVATIAATDNQTFLGHHYVPSGKTCYVTGISGCHNGTVVGSGGLFQLLQNVVSPNAALTMVGDFVRSYGQSATVVRNFVSAPRIVGPAKLSLFVTPEAATAIVYRGGFDFYEI